MANVLMLKCQPVKHHILSVIDSCLPCCTLSVRTYMRPSLYACCSSRFINSRNSQRLQYRSLSVYNVSRVTTRDLKTAELLRPLSTSRCLRHSSTSSLSAAAAASSSTVTDLSSLASDAQAGVDAATSIVPLIEPTLQSLGLATWAPSGFVQAGLEFLHNCDLPWWQAIVIGTIAIRLAIFPLFIKAQRNAAEMHNHMPTMQRIQERITQARMCGDNVEAVRSTKELTQFMQRNNVNPFRSLLVPMAQMPIFMSVFFGIRGMTELPVASMKMGGMLWFTDLTIPDPYFALPILTAATLFTIVELGAEGLKASDMGKQVRVIMRIMPFVMIPFIIHFPAAMLCYWFTSNMISLLLVLFMRIPGVKPFFKIPKLTDHCEAAPIRKRDVSKKSFMEGFSESMANMRLAAEMEQRQRHNALKLKEPQRTLSTKNTTREDSVERPK